MRLLQLQYSTDMRLEAQDYYAKVQASPSTNIPPVRLSVKEVPSTCTEDGSYDEVVYCTVCKEEISRVSKTIPPWAHDFSVKGETVAPH